MAAKNPDRRAMARALYERDHLPVQAIAAHCGLSRATIARWAKQDQWNRDTPETMIAPEEPIDRRALVIRAWRNAERQLRIVEKRLRMHGADEAGFDENARLIATLVKTLRELTALDRALLEPMDDHGAIAAGQRRSEIPRDLDAFYEELAARMDRLRQNRDSDGSSERSAASVD